MNENHNNDVTMKQTVYIYYELLHFACLPDDTSEFICLLLDRLEEASSKCSDKLSDSFISAGSLASELPKLK